MKLALIILLGLLNEEEIIEPDPEPTTETIYIQVTPEPTATPTPDSEIIIQYLEEQKALQEEAEKIRLENEEKARLEAETLAIQNVQNNGYTSQSNVVNGWLQKYRYYIVGQRLISDTYSRYDYYIWLFSPYTRFNIDGNTITFSNGTCTRVYVPYSGNPVITELGGNTTTVDSNLYNVYSSISEFNVPASPNISKSAEIAYEEMRETMVIYSVIIVGYLWLRLIIRGWH